MLAKVVDNYFVLWLGKVSHPFWWVIANYFFTIMAYNNFFSAQFFIQLAFLYYQSPISINVKYHVVSECEYIFVFT